MIYQNSITNALFTILSSNQSIIDIDAKIRVNDLFNQDPNNTPWIGIYNSDINFTPETVQKPFPWKVQYAPVIYIQAQNFSFEGKQTVDDLEDLLNKTLTAIDTHSNVDRTLMGTVDIMKGYSVEPFQFDVDENNNIFSYQITINAEKIKNNGVFILDDPLFGLLDRTYNPLS